MSGAFDGFYRYVAFADVQAWLDRGWIWQGVLPMPPAARALLFLPAAALADSPAAGVERACTRTDCFRDLDIWKRGGRASALLQGGT